MEKLTTGKWNNGLGALKKIAIAMAVFGAMGTHAIKAHAQEIQLSFISGFPFSGPMGEVVMHSVKGFIAEFNKRAAGKARINFVGGPEVVAPFDQLKALQSGQFDMMSSAPSWFRETAPLTFIDYMPSARQVSSMENGGRALLQRVGEEAAGVTFVKQSFPGLPFHVWSRKPIVTVADAKNIKIRAFPAFSSQLAQQLGMVPTNIPVSEVYSALRSGILDASIRDTVAIALAKEVDFVKYYTDAVICSCNGMVFIATPVWKKLPADVKEIMLKVAAEKEVEQLKFLTDKVAENSARFKKDMGVTETATSPELREIIARKIPANNVRASLEGIKNREEIVRHFGLATLLDGK
ncbi:TRAP transporter substrate-binding protein [Rheinheimera sp.]|uniref:TRAP transporter substrate-binding protein n=1 Tax=Rheinheimera sp. TaxID=1869214 RepID=UPI004047CC08